MTGIQPGDWVDSKRFGHCVCIEVREDHLALRYKAKHLRTQQTIWVGGTDGWAACKFLRPADEESRHVLTLTGYAPFGGSKI
jgi:hypothetical protein